MDLKARRINADDWYRLGSRRVDKAFHNLILRDTELCRVLGRLYGLFPGPPPPGHGVYSHHDGLRG